MIVSMSFNTSHDTPEVQVDITKGGETTISLIWARTTSVFPLLNVTEPQYYHRLHNDISVSKD
jgi:hypothetical protein